MRETFFLRLSGLEPETPTECCLAPEAAAQSWPVERLPLSEALGRARGHRLVVIAPTEDLRIERLDLPVKQAAKAAQAARYALEEALAEDVEELHFAVGARLPEGGFPVGVVARERMQAWLATLASAGLAPQQLVAEPLLLPPAEPDGALEALAEPGRVVVRHAPWGSFVATPEDLAMLLDLVDPERQRTLRLRLTREVDFDASRLGRPTELLGGFNTALEALLPQWSEAPALNLLQGEFAPQASLKRHWQPWQAPAALAAVLLLLIGSQNVIAGKRLAAQVEAQDQRNAERFRQLFPSETRIVDLAAQAEQQLAQARARGGGTGVLPLMSALIAALGPVEGLQVQGLQYREQTLVVSLTGQSLQQLEALREAFRNLQQVQMDVQSANAGADGVQIRIRITPA